MKYQSKEYPESIKCYGCGWTTTKKFAAPGLDIDEDGLCAECWMDVVEKTALSLL